MSERDDAKHWLTENRIEDVEAFVPDMAGAARGKVIPADKFTEQSMKMPEAVFAQTISGEYIDDDTNQEDRDMILVPDYDTLRPVPWAVDTAASVFLDCLRLDGEPVPKSPRQILRQVMALYEEQGWQPIVAPEVEFYLIKSHTDADEEVEPPEGRLGRTDLSRQPYSIDTMNDFEPFIMDVYKFCEAQGIRIDTLSQEMGPAQFEINFLHGDPIDLADQVFLFKRTVREAAIRHEMHATFLAKPMADEPGSALHIHQSVIRTEDGSNVFSTGDGEASDLFYAFLGGLQVYLPEAMLILAPYVNSYRRFQSYSAAPVWFAIESLEASEAMRRTLGEAFVRLYCNLKKAEYAEFQHVITPWERELLLLNV
ncbi:MAG: glutamine synthetase family protein [Gammaproteobacteria bacterium]